jgi:hypothetical protein
MAGQFCNGYFDTKGFCMKKLCLVAFMFLCCHGLAQSSGVVQALRPNIRLVRYPDQQMANRQGGDSMEMPHMDHRPHHHGIFFMAPDNIHHIEGVLAPSNNFRLYLYDEYTKPLPAEKVRKTKAYLVVEGVKQSPQLKVPLIAGNETLDASLCKNLKLPVVLKLSIVFADLPSNIGPETFSFHFRRYSGSEASEKDSPDSHGSGDMHMHHPI